MAGDIPYPPFYGGVDDEHPHDPSGSELDTGDGLHDGGGHDDTSPRRRRLPAWLVHTVAALLVGVLAGAFLFGGSDDAPAATAAVPPADDGEPTAPLVVTSLTRAEPVQVDIPAIDVGSPLVDLGLNDDGTLEVPVDFAKAGWFTGGNFPGDPQGPPALIAGHVDDHTGPAVFHRLRDLEVGDEVLVTRADNTVAVFAVREKQQYAKDSFPADRVYAPVGNSELVLITCSGDFDEAARSYESNLVVRATLDLERSLEESQARLASGVPAPAGNLRNAR